MGGLRCYRHKGDTFAFCYSTKKHTDFHKPEVGLKFWAIKYRINQKTDVWSPIKRVPTGRRKKAKERAHKWYEERRPVYEKHKAAKNNKPAPTPLEINEKKIKTLAHNLARLVTKKKTLETLIRKRSKALNRMIDRTEKIRAEGSS